MNTDPALDAAALLLCGRAGEGNRETPCLVHRDDAAELLRRYLDALNPDALAGSWESAAGIQHVLAIIRPAVTDDTGGDRD